MAVELARVEVEAVRAAATAVEMAAVRAAAVARAAM